MTKAAGTPSPQAVTRLRAAMDAYDRATLGSLNATADELRAAATACGWSWDGGVKLIKWSRDVLATAAPQGGG